MFRRLVSFEESLRRVASEVKPEALGAEEVTLLEATGRVLAENVEAMAYTPPFDRATVDGYAVRAEDTFGAEENRPVTLKIRGSVRIGELPKLRVGKGQAAEIVTGAPIPKGADAAVMLEYAERKGNRVLIFKAIANNGNVLKAGADIKKGETVLTHDTLLGSREIGVLAALGLDAVRVRRIPRVAVFSTGPEVIKPGEKLPAGKIYDINGHSLSSAVLECGGESIYLGVVEDDFSKLHKALEKALESAEIVVTSGGASVGPKDLMPRVLASFKNSKVVFSGVAIKPGKPTTFAVIERKLVFSLPGHPTSALLVFELLVRPAIRWMAHKPFKEEPKMEAAAAARMFSARGRRTFVMVTLKREKSGRFLAEPVSRGDSGAITTLAKSDGFVEIPENVQFVDAGENVTVHLFRPLM